MNDQNVQGLLNSAQTKNASIIRRMQDPLRNAFKVFFTHVILTSCKFRMTFHRTDEPTNLPQREWPLPNFPLFDFPAYVRLTGMAFWWEQLYRFTVSKVV